MGCLGESSHTGGYICEKCVGWWVFVPELEAGVVIGVGTILRASLELDRSNALHPEMIFVRISSKIWSEAKRLTDLGKRARS